jgi:phosphinothricin acetyltransferase
LENRLQIRTAVRADAEAIARIYNHYVAETVITFEERFVSPEAMATRVEECLERYAWMVCIDADAVIGYAYASEWKSRTAFRHSAEVSIYLDPAQQGRGIGRKLMSALLEELRAKKLHLLIAGIALPNDSSIALHEKFGFRKIGQFDEVGFKFGRWVDVGYWQLLLESPG